jgi:glutamine synthetase adenylyltransferase
MTASSDLDLVFVYDVPPGVEASDGAKPLRRLCTSRAWRSV